MATEAVVPVGTADNKQIRNVVTQTQVGGAAPAPALQQVITLADANGNLLDLALSTREDVMVGLLAEIKRELMIQNELLATWMTATAAPVPGSLYLPPIDLDKEYRTAREYDTPNVPKQ